MSRGRLGALGWVVALALTSSAATAGESVKELEKKLLGDGDFRVRTQAALALGASGVEGAVKPLCRGLDDGTDTVRAAAAAGLGRLQKGGKACLETRLGKEDSSNVQKMIKKALRLIEEATTGPQLGSDTKYYVSIAAPKANAGRDEVPGVVRAALIRIAAAAGDFAFAPADETAQQAAKRLRKHPQVAAFHLVPTVEVSRGAGRIEVSVDLEIFGYPDKNPQGSVGRSAGVTGVDPKDTQKENQLIDKVCAEAMREFTRLAAQVD
jgi:hypothetical protein